MMDILTLLSPCKQEINLPCERCTPCLCGLKDTLNVRDREFRQRNLSKQTTLLSKFTTTCPNSV